MRIGSRNIGGLEWFCLGMNMFMVCIGVSMWVYGFPSSLAAWIFAILISIGMVALSVHLGTWIGKEEVLDEN